MGAQAIRMKDEQNTVGKCFSAADADAMGRRYELKSIEGSMRANKEQLEGRERFRKFYGRSGHGID